MKISVFAISVVWVAASLIGCAKKADESAPGASVAVAESTAGTSIRERIYHLFAKPDANGMYPDKTLSDGHSAMQGRVTAGKDESVSGAHVVVYSSEFKRKAETDTDANGAYTFFLPPDSYHVEVGKPGYQWTGFSQETHSQRWVVANPVSLNPAGPLDGVQVRLAETGVRNGVRLILTKNLLTGEPILLRCYTNLSDGHGNGVCPEPVVRITYTLKTVKHWYVEGCDDLNAYSMNPGVDFMDPNRPTPDGTHIAACVVKP